MTTRKPDEKVAPKAEVAAATDASNPADPPSQHASSTPDQASQSQKDDAPLVVVADEPEEADNVIERTTREMAAAGHSAAEIAAYREEALRNLGGAPKVEHEEK